MGSLLTGKGVFAAHWMVMKLTGLPRLEVCPQSPGKQEAILWSIGELLPVGWLSTGSWHVSEVDGLKLVMSTLERPQETDFQGSSHIERVKTPLSTWGLGWQFSCWEDHRKVVISLSQFFEFAKGPWLDQSTTDHLHIHTADQMCSSRNLQQKPPSSCNVPPVPSTMKVTCAHFKGEILKGIPAFTPEQILKGEVEVEIQ